jgi:hypothetical protein
VTTDIVPTDILPINILPIDILPIDIVTTDILPTDILPTDILPMLHINKWLTANVMITSASLDKNCLNRTLLSSSYTTATCVGMNL